MGSKVGVELAPAIGIFSPSPMATKRRDSAARRGAGAAGCGGDDQDTDEPIVGRRTEQGTDIGWVTPRGERLWGCVPVFRPPSVN